MSQASDIVELLGKSESTDLAVLLKAKEDAKRLMMDIPSRPNLDAYDKATRMLESAQRKLSAFKSRPEALAYLQDSGRKLQKTKFYDDINAGKLKEQADGSFLRSDLDVYAASLPVVGTSSKVAKDAAERQRRKEEAEIRRIEAAAARDEHRLEVDRGKFIRKDEVFTELAARAVTLAAGLKTALESSALDIINMVEGNPKKVINFMQAVDERLDAAMNEYADLKDFEVMFTAEEDQDAIQDNQEAE